MSLTTVSHHPTFITSRFTLKTGVSPFSMRVFWATVALVLCMGITGCGKETKVTRVDTGVVTDFSGRWNDTDSRQVAEAMMKEMMSQPWLGNFTRDNGKPPVVIVGTVLNRSHEHINVGTFVTDLERELTNSQKVRFVASKTEREEIREERPRPSCSRIGRNAKRTRPRNWRGLYDERLYFHHYGRI